MHVAMAVSNGVAADGWYGGSNDDTPDIHLLYDALVDPETGVLSAGHYDIQLPGQKGYRHFKLAEAVDIVKVSHEHFRGIWYPYPHDVQPGQDAGDAFGGKWSCSRPACALNPLQTRTWAQQLKIFATSFDIYIYNRFLIYAYGADMCFMCELAHCLKA